VSSFALQRYLTIRRAYGAWPGPELTLAFLRDTTGTAQVWTLTEPGSRPRQHTLCDDPVSFVPSSLERPALAFGMDEGHGIANLENQIEAYTRVVESLEEHV